MKRLAAIVPLLALALVSGSLLLAAPADEEGFKPLFNGKDLTGWEYRLKKDSPEQVEGKTETSDKRFTVEDGVIVANVGRGIKDLYTTQAFDKDFVLRLEFRAGPKADSGVYIRGKQQQVRDFIRRNEMKQLKKFKNDDWNELEFTVKGTDVVATINGEPLGKMKVPAKGAIGLQAESGKFEFRNVRIKETP